MNKKDKQPGECNKLTGTFITQPISQPDHRQPKTNMAMPDDENVTINREWVNFNEK